MGKQQDYFEASVRRQQSIRASYQRLATARTWHTFSSMADGAERSKKAIADDVWEYVAGQV